MSTRSGRGSWFRRCMKATLRMLDHACDFYVRSITRCGSIVAHGDGMGFPGMGVAERHERSYIIIHQDKVMIVGEEDMRALSRLTSERPTTTTTTTTVTTATTMTRRRRRSREASCSAAGGLGTIDEDKPCYFDNDEVKLGSNLVLRRSRSCSDLQSKRKRQMLLPMD